MAKSTERSVYGWNRDDTFEVVRTRSSVGDKQWWVSIRSLNHEWWHSDAVYSEVEAKVLFDHFCTLPGGLLEATRAELVRAETAEETGEWA